MRTHKDLEIWQKGIELVEKIYRLTASFPKEESYGLTSQMMTFSNFLLKQYSRRGSKVIKKRIHSFWIYFTWNSI
jgi:hypothetical protein